MSFVVRCNDVIVFSGNSVESAVQSNVSTFR